jgi:hypothetical protein
LQIPNRILDLPAAASAGNSCCYRTSSKLDKSVLIGTQPLTRAPLQEIPNGYRIGTDLLAARRHELLLSGTSSKLDKSVWTTQPLNSSPLLRNP